MKKLLTLLVLMFLSGSCVFAAQAPSASALKSMYNKMIGKEKKIQQPQATTSDDTVSPSKEAMIFYNNNETKKAFDILVKIPDTERTAQDWVLLGNILQDQEKISDAVFMYQRAIATDPTSYKPYYNLGNIYLADEKPFLAIENYRKANKANNTFAYGYYNLGCAYVKAGDLKKAKIAFLKAIELKNNEPDFHYNLAYTYKKLGKDKLAKQYLQFYNKALEAKGE